ncbi:MAG: TonB-dependent receptor [Verrucomicrobia bacterium]|nr:TonB-dependent receptor [Verrucomicrobiota bacterium]
MNARNPWKRAVLFALLAPASLLTEALAQPAAAPKDEKKDESVKLDKFVVTGSMIKRLESEGALPIVTITPIELEQRGVVSAEQMLMELNINGNALDNLASNADVVAGAQRGNNGATSANLRMQGAGATLILLNGRRVSSHGLNGGVVDLNQIPFAALERVEILKDGASAIYGTDAVGGVINFILKNNYQGSAASAAMDATEQGGGNIFRYNAVAGFGDLNRDRYNLMVSVSRADHKVLRGDQRDFVNTFQPARGVSPDTRGTPIATLFAIGSAAVPVPTVLSGSGAGATTSSVGPVDPQNASLRVNGVNYVDLPGGPGYAGLDGMGPYDEVLWASPASKYGSAWDTGRAAVIQQPVKNTNLVTRGTFKLTDQHRLTFEGVFGRSVSNKSFSPNQWTSSAAATTTALDGRTTVPNPLFRMLYPSTGASYNKVFNVLAAYFPELAPNRGLPMAFRWRSLPLGNRAYTTTTDTWRAMVGAEGPLGFLSQWDYRIGASRAQSRGRSVINNGYVFTVPFVNLINTGVVDPFSYTQTPEAMAAIDKTRANGVAMYGGTYRTDEYDAVASGSVMKLPAGMLQAAVGVDWRQESFIFTGDTRQNLNSSDALIFNAPFDNSLATAGTLKRTIKAAFAELQIPIVKGLDLNAAGRLDQYSGFGTAKNPKYTLRWAPMDKFLVRSAYSTGFRVPTFKQQYDPVTESPLASTGLIDPGTGQQIAPNSATTLFGGKPDLQPEKAKMYSAGVVLQPFKHLSANVDWWSVNRRGTIQSFGTTQLLQNYSLFQDRFQRRADGTIQRIDTRWVNAGQTSTRGIDFGVKGDMDVGAKGKLTASFDMSYLLEKKSRLLPTAPWSASEIDVFTRSSDIGLHAKHSATLGYRRGNWSFLVNEIYRNSYRDAVLPGVGTGTGQIIPARWNPIVKPYNVYGLSATYRGFRNTTIIAGVKNLFNTDPPFSATYDTNSGAGSSWEPRIADPRGRSYTLRVDYKFDKLRL